MNTRADFERRLVNLDLQPICFSLVRAEEGPRWTIKQANIVEYWYRKFHLLQHLNPDEVIVPTRAVDIFWHHHILDTRKYYDDCQYLHGKIIHHFPYFGVRGEDDRAALRQRHNATINLYLEAFGDAPVDDETAFPGFEAVICGTLDIADGRKLKDFDFSTRPRLNDVVSANR